MKTTYDHIGENAFRTVILLALYPLALAVVVGLVFLVMFVGQGVPQDMAWLETQTILSDVLPFVVAGAFIWMGFSYYMGGRMMLSSVGAKAIAKQDNSEIYRLVENLAITAGLPTPQIYIIEDPSLNAFATGRDPAHGSITLTTGLLQHLNKQELEGVIAHEIAHIRNRDIRLMLLAIAGVGFFSFVGEMLVRSSGGGSSNDRNKSVFMFLGLGLLIFGYLVAPLIRLATSRQREYQADATAALLTRHPKALASALEKIQGDPQVEAMDHRPSMALMCIENPLKPGAGSLFGWLSGLYSTHPPLADRIARLREMDGMDEGGRS